MTTVNALIAMKVSTWRDAKSLVAGHKDAVGTGTAPTANQEKAVKVFKVMNQSDPEILFRVPTLSGDTWALASILIDPKTLEKLDENVPGLVVAGCWNEDGSQYGTQIEVDPDGVETITGTPVYPIHPKLLDFMPDDVVYDEKGLEVSRTRPTKLKQVHKYLGWADRRWD